MGYYMTLIGFNRNIYVKDKISFVGSFHLVSALSMKILLKMFKLMIDLLNCCLIDIDGCNPIHCSPCEQL